MKEKIEAKTPKIHKVAKGTFWFFVGIFLGLFLFLSFVFIAMQRMNKDVVYQGVMVKGIDFGGKTEDDVQEYFKNLNNNIDNTQFIFTYAEQVATVSAKEINYGYDSQLLASQAYSVGRSGNIVSDVSLMLQAYINGINLPPAYRYDEETLLKTLQPIIETVTITPVDAQFTFQDNRVTTFKPSSNGQEVDMELLKSRVGAKAVLVLSANKPKNITFQIPVKTIKPNVTTEEVNNLGITELIASGTSLFTGSIPNRIYNITLASSRLNGVLVKPGETFSFVNTIGDVSSFTGYKQAYIIQGGRTVLGDGGGVCQVSTTFFRALLNAGLPIVERHAHAYRVGYYELDSPPGLDAAIYTPTVDLKFKNDTGNHILIQTEVDPVNQRLTFYLYGTKDGREVTLGKPVIVSQSPAPEPLYQDDPNLPKGELKQVDFAASGAKVYFTRQVTKNGKVLTDDTFNSTFRPWQAVFLRGTKE